MSPVTNNPVQELVEQIQGGELPEDELIDLLHDVRLLVRANALMALSRTGLQDEARAVEAIRAAAMGPHSEQKLVGTLTQKMLAAMVLKRMGSQRATDAFNQVVAGWTETQMADLEWQLSNNPL